MQILKRPPKFSKIMNMLIAKWPNCPFENLGFHNINILINIKKIYKNLKKKNYTKQII